MADLADANHVYGNDLAVSATGDIALVTKSQRTIQRIIRRLMTAPTNSKGSAYPWQPEYGVGLGARIGESLDIRGIQGDVRSQMMLEPSVKKIPAPIVTVAKTDLGASITVSYTDLSGLPKSFNFDI
jgi:hypothetical protein